MRQRQRYQIAGFAAIIGLIAGYPAGATMHFPPFRVQRLLQNPIADAAVIVLGIGTVLSLAVWAQRPDRRERRALVASMIGVNGVAVVLNVLAPALGWWGGPVFGAPLFPLAVLTGLRAMAMIGILLLVYRWLGERSVWLARGFYLAILAALIPGTIVGDEMVLRSGAMTFGRGYTIWKDMLLGEIIFAFAAVLYETVLRAIRERPELARPAKLTR